MQAILILLAIAAGLALLFLLLTFLCFLITFFSPNIQWKHGPEYPLPPGKIYVPFHDLMLKWMKEMRTLPHEDVTVTSFDGLKLQGKYYEYAPDAPIELMFHGYRGTAERDLCVGVQRCFALGRNALVVDQRGAGRSEGHVITFGIKERQDCLTWVNFMVDKFGPDVKIILTGISMGAATVMMAAGMELPSNVVGILADCGYTSPKEIICKVICQLHLPVKFFYPIIRWGAKIFGKFDLEETSPIDAMAHSCVPAILFHGEDDAFVPCSMSRENYEACIAPKQFLTIPGAGHGLAYPVDPEAYLTVLSAFFTQNGLPTPILTTNTNN